MYSMYKIQSCVWFYLGFLEVDTFAREDKTCRQEILAGNGSALTENRNFSSVEALF